MLKQNVYTSIRPQLNCIYLNDVHCICTAVNPQIVPKLKHIRRLSQVDTSFDLFQYCLRWHYGFPMPYIVDIHKLQVVHIGCVTSELMPLVPQIAVKVYTHPQIEPKCNSACRLSQVDTSL